MKNIHILLALLFVSCTESKYTNIGQEIIDGKVSASAVIVNRRGVKQYRFWIQNATETKEIELPTIYKEKWKVGDSCLLIIEKYKENETK
jgi:hypothetical protein